MKKPTTLHIKPRVNPGGTTAYQVTGYLGEKLLVRRFGACPEPPDENNDAELDLPCPICHISPFTNCMPRSRRWNP